MLSQQLSKLVIENNRIAINLFKHNANKVRVSSIFKRKYGKTNSDVDAEINKPLKYTTSQAHDWKAAHSRIGSKAEFGPWYEPHAISASIILFMVYFFILREENDIDLMFDQPIVEILKEK